MTVFHPAILYVDDEQANLDTFKRAFGSDYLVRTCLSAQEALDVLREGDVEFPLVIADQRMPGMTGIELCEKLIAIRPQTIRMILTAYTETEILLNAINRGRVHDYVVKPWKKSELKPVIEKAFESYKSRAMKMRELEERASRAERLVLEIEDVYDFEGLIGSSTGLRDVVDVIKKAAPTDATVLINGETGTGKEMVARAVHSNSLRKNGPFVAVHCAALARTILESELFGHEKGAFTGADEVRAGRFEMAKGGTIFLDEVGDIPEDVQVKLLRVLQERRLERVGSNRSIPVDVRIIAATNKDLNAEVSAGRFRKDFYYRLNVVPLRVPPLRERLHDVPYLANHFLIRFNRQTGRSLQFDPRVFETLGRYDWPGNVRELQNIVERAVILSPGPSIEPSDLNLPLTESLQVETVKVDHLPAPGDLRSRIQEEEANRLIRTLRDADGNIAEAARALGVARSTLFYRLKKFGMI